MYRTCRRYQISQYEKPLCRAAGWSCQAETDQHCIHLERTPTHSEHAVFIDYNRSGVPLIEIVTEPDFRSAEEATEYLEKLQTILRAVGVSDCRMQEGSLRCDVNISLRRPGDSAYGIRTEIKNLNSFAAVHDAVMFEYERQSEILRAGGAVEQGAHLTPIPGRHALRGKENADDYRYFPEPDIITVVIPDDVLNRLGQPAGLPDRKLMRYVSEMRVPRPTPGC